MKALLSLSFLVLAAVLVLSYLFGTVVPPGYIGVRQINFGPGQGYGVKGLKPGYHWAVPFYSTVHLVPKKIQILHLERERGGDPEAFGSLEVQTTDGSTVDVDISVIKSFYSEPGEDAGVKHGGPSDLIRNVGLRQALWDKYLRVVVNDSLRRTLGSLSSSQFYNPDLREARVKEAFADIRTRVAGFGFKVESVLVRRYTYQAERIDNAIFQKNLQAQEEALNSAGSRLAEARAKLEQVSAQLDAKIENLKVEGENHANVLRSEAKLYETEKRALGDLEVAKAQAEIERLRAGALAQSDAARTYVAKELAPLLSSLKGGVVSDVDPYSLDGWSKKLGIVPR